MAATYHIRIKKEYAAALIEDLQKVDADEFLAGQQESTEVSPFQQRK